MSDEINPIQSFEDFQKERQGASIIDIHKALVLDVEVKKIPESTFIQEILPVIIGESTNADFPALVAAVAGNPFLEVDVIDNAGNILFRMPSLLERNIFNHEAASKRGSLQSLFITAGMLQQQSPRRANNYLAHEFANRGIAQNKAELIAARAVRWTEIFARYGKVYESTNKSGVAVTTPEKQQRMDLDIENGDLF